jgi:hypothetical protein
MRQISFVLLLVACGKGQFIDGFSPPPPTASEKQIVSPVIHDILPGQDVTYCSYLDANFDQDVDVVGYEGFQSKTGHHAILYAARVPQPVGTHLCTGDDMNNGRFLASTGTDTSAPGQTIPPGVAFRIPKGTQVYLQTHWINASTKTIEGQAVINLDVLPVDPSRTVAAEFVTIKIDGLNVVPGWSTLSTECKIASPLQLYMLGGHQHEHGAHVSIDKVVGSQATRIYDQDWQSQFTFDTPFVSFGTQQPLKFAEGDVMRVTCSWNNNTPQMIGFPDEMCVGFGYYFPARAGDIYCIDGMWPTN